MTVHIKMRNIDIYHPQNKVGNEYFFDFYEKQGKDIRKFMKYLNKVDRYRINNPEENALTMAIESSKKVLEKSGLSISDMDMIVFSTQTPEFTVPTNASLLHRELGGAGKTRIMDMNSTCSGMTMAVEQASYYIKGNPKVKYVLVVGSDHLTQFTNPYIENNHAVFGDASCAVILEQTDENTGFIDAEYHTHTEFVDNMKFPALGLSKVLQKREAGKYLSFTPFDTRVTVPYTEKMIEDLLERNELTIADIDAFCFSQLAYSDTLHLQERFGIDGEKVIYIGNKYGYTGTTSPFISFYEGVQQNKIKRGDTVLFWTVGAGHQLVAMLFKY